MKDFFYLDNGTIRAKILYPRNAKYNGARFCHAGFIADVWYRGVKFSEYERSQPGFPTTEGSGLCCAYEPIQMMADELEAVKAAAGKNPAGEAAAGKTAADEARAAFTGQAGISEGIRRRLMPGVGVVTESDLGNFCEPLPVDFYFDTNHAVFETQSPEVNGYSYFEKRQIALEGGEIEETVTFTNTGSKRLVCSEYGHNFLSLAGRDISPDYEMRVFCANLPGTFSDNEMVLKDGAFTFMDYPDRSFFFKTFDTAGTHLEKDGLAWVMRSKSTGISCYEKVDFKPERVQVWGDYYVFCCEVFAGVDLLPGESVSWKRTWGFTV